MASELEPEVPAIDRSLLECSAEETAGVSVGPGRDVRPSQAEPRGRTDSRKSRSRPAPRPPRVGRGLPSPLYSQTAPKAARCPRARNQQLLSTPPSPQLPWSPGRMASPGSAEERAFLAFGVSSPCFLRPVPLLEASGAPAAPPRKAPSSEPLPCCRDRPSAGGRPPSRPPPCGACGRATVLTTARKVVFPRAYRV